MSGRRCAPAFVLDALDGVLLLAWLELSDGLPQLHSVGLTETQPGRFDLFYRALTPLEEEAEMLGEYTELCADPEGQNPAIQGLSRLNNRRAVCGNRRPFDRLPLLVVTNNPDVERGLVSLWRAVCHFESAELFGRLRGFHAYGPLWLVHREPLFSLRPCGPEALMDEAETVEDRRDAHAVAILHWWNLSRRRPQRIAAIVAFAAAWHQAERDGIAAVRWTDVERYLGEYGLPLDLMASDR